MMAAWKGDTGCASKLISMGADLKAVDSGGRNAWGVAHDWHKEEVIPHSAFLTSASYLIHS